MTDPVKINHEIASDADDTGFNSLSTFDDVFRKATGLTPSHYRKQPVEIPQKKRVSGASMGIIYISSVPYVLKTSKPPCRHTKNIGMKIWFESKGWSLHQISA